MAFLAAVAGESMKETEDLFELTLLARRGARLVSNLVIEDTDEYFQTKVKVRGHRCLNVLQIIL